MRFDKSFRLTVGESKGQLISKGLFGTLEFLQKTKKKFVYSTVRPKKNSFVRFLEESSAWKNHFEFVWPLGLASMFTLA